MLNGLLRVTKLHFVQTFSIFFVKLSFVRITPFLMYQRKTLIFKVNLTFQKGSCMARSFVMSLYKDRTEKSHFYVSHIKRVNGTMLQTTNATGNAMLVL